MNFKKHLSIFLAFFLLVSNTGFAIDVHYCGGKIASINPVFLNSMDSNNGSEKGCCASNTSSKIKKKDSCCKDKVVHFQKKSDNVIVKIVAFQSDNLILVEDWKPVTFTHISFVETNNIPSYYCDANAPPLFQLYHQYLLYA